MNMSQSNTHPGNSKSCSIAILLGKKTANRSKNEKVESVVRRASENLYGNRKAPFSVFLRKRFLDPTGRSPTLRYSNSIRFFRSDMGLAGLLKIWITVL